MAGPHLQGADTLGLNEIGQGIGILRSGGAKEERMRKREMKEDKVAVRINLDLPQISTTYNMQVIFLD